MASTITDTNWQSADVAGTGSAANGCKIVSDLLCNISYCWAIFIIDEAGNRSPLSNVVQQATQGCSSTQEMEECQ